MTKAMMALFRKLPGFVPGLDYGPKYEATGPDGTVYKVGRHKWCLPESRWAWKAEAPGKPTEYGDTLEDLAYELGLTKK